MMAYRRAVRSLRAAFNLGVAPQLLPLWHRLSRSFLIRHSVASFSIRLFSFGLGFLTSIALARLMSLEGFGVYNFTIAWASLLAIPTVMGMDRLLIRELAVSQQAGNWSAMRGLTRFANLAVFAASILIVVGGIVVGQFLFLENSALKHSFWLGLLLLPLMAFTLLRQSSLRGLNHVVLSQIPEGIILPFLFLASVGVLVLFDASRFSAPLVLLIRVASASIAYVVGMHYLRTRMPREVQAAPPTYQIRRWVKSAMPLMLVGGAQIINVRIDVIMLGNLRDMETVAIYNVTFRIVQFITFALVAVNNVIAPQIATLFLEQNLTALQRLVTSSTRLIGFGAGGITVLLLLLAPWALLIHGESYTAGYTTLVILALGRLINSLMGPTGTLLVMTGHETKVAQGIVLGAIANIVANALLIPIWGTNGAAFASVISTSIWNLVLVRIIVKQLNINPTIFGRLA